ncbi:uncharacterized protein C8Q71DRAFT_305280 [Rhodofomes roseus]|uniref:Uncharacterized protein n=1 Tax=Rhodofomes roseus TaxID=34475 RepID=A0ABQ8K4Q9_9APHY|nr:uncharacterized protein C8Q71DRAFT_305280 [Rhodofomes roseus]KAH9831479.1 hypothetical protein C8Q71DRAFT_305280 [Rhodofomes roseus]
MAVKVKRPLGTEGSGVWSTPRTIVSRAVRETNRRQDHECRSTVIPTIANVGESAKDPEGKHIYGSYTLRPNVPPAFISRAKQCCLPYSRTALCARTQAAAPHHHIESITIPGGYGVRRDVASSSFSRKCKSQGILVHTPPERNTSVVCAAGHFTETISCTGSTLGSVHVVTLAAPSGHFRCPYYVGTGYKCVVVQYSRARAVHVAEPSTAVTLMLNNQAN